MIYFAGIQVIEKWNAVSSYEWNLNPEFVALSILVHIMTFVLFSKAWCVLMRGFGFNIPLKTAFKIGYIANLGRYVPGKVWPVVGMAYYLKKINVNLDVAVASWGIATILGIPPAFLAGFITVYLYPQMIVGIFGSDAGAGLSAMIMMMIAISIFLIFVPSKTIAIYNSIIRVLKRRPIKFDLSRKVALSVYAWYFISWICYGSAFIIFSRGMLSGAEIPLIAGIGSFILAYVIGYLAFFAPGGLGARELILTAVLTSFMGSGAVGLVIAARLWNLTNEIIAAGIALGIRME